MTTLYILAAIRWEERDLSVAHPEYVEYRGRTPMLVPRIRIPDLRTSRRNEGRALATATVRATIEIGDPTSMAHESG